MKKDDIYGQPLQQVADFQFDENVVRVFPDMINRSVPGYSTLINLIGIIGREYAQDNTRIYDLGCSLGAASLSLGHYIEANDCELIAVDNSAAMIEQASELLRESTPVLPMELVCADIRDIKIENASVVILNFTLQFLSPDDRARVIETIYQGLVPGGVLLLSEKICFDAEQKNEQFIELHHQFKRANGYSDLEISQKRTALENVLIPETIDAHQTRLSSAGFQSVDVWFQCLNFVSLLAHKS
ncbi:MAG: carboxy-S-adenosyl-L-methionine synthase CmoA [Gammaproteobacteria bacterium]|nr:carboxy-S-adenosyl-L-methionine synthase CmoA [Gammaproteobacteria bacterium]